MNDRPLAAIRTEIESLATTDGRYVLVCARTRQRPTPVENLAFATRAEAARAARLTEAYRRTLREYDRAVPFYDVVACERPALRSRPVSTARSGSAGGDGFESASVDGSGAEPLDEFGLESIDGFEPAASRRVRFCHRLASALFEALRSTDHAAVERAVMDTYRSVADRIADPDALCLRLIDEIAIELDQRLSPAQQLSICSDAAARLPAPTTQDTYAVVGAFERLVTVDLLEQFTVSPWFHDDVTDAASCAVEVREYALWPRDAAITTLPITVDVLRRQPAATVAFDPAVRLGDRSWEFRLETNLDTRPDGVARTKLEV